MCWVQLAEADGGDTASSEGQSDLGGGQSESSMSGAESKKFATSAAPPAESSEPNNSKAYFSPHRPFGIKYYFNLTVSSLRILPLLLSTATVFARARQVSLVSQPAFTATSVVCRRPSMTARSIWCICRRSRSTAIVHTAPHHTSVHPSSISLPLHSSVDMAAHCTRPTAERSVALSVSAVSLGWKW